MSPTFGRPHFPRSRADRELPIALQLIFSSRAIGYIIYKHMLLTLHAQIDITARAMVANELVDYNGVNDIGDNSTAFEAWAFIYSPLRFYE